MKKLFGIIFTFVILGCISQANAAINSIDRAIKASSINRSAISVSIRNIQTGAEIYSLHAQRPVTPASTQKLVTFA